MTNVTVFPMFYVLNEEQKVKNFKIEREANYSFYHALEYGLQLALIFYQQDYRTVNFLRKFMGLEGVVFFVQVFKCLRFLLERGSTIFHLYMFIACIYKKEKGFVMLFRS